MEKFSIKNNFFDISDFIWNLVSYVWKNKINSNLIYFYTEIYLSISLYYSSFPDFDNQENLRFFIINLIKFIQLETLMIYQNFPISLMKYLIIYEILTYLG